MTKRMLIDATHAEETRVVVLDGNRLEDFDVETATKKQLKGNIYLAKVVRVEPSLQAAFVEYGGGRHGFLAFSEIHPDYYQIPVADRQRLLAMQEAEARAEEEADDAADAAADAAEVPEHAGPAQTSNVEHVESFGTGQIETLTTPDDFGNHFDAPAAEAPAEQPGIQADAGIQAHIGETAATDAPAPTETPEPPAAAAEPLAVAPEPVAITPAEAVPAAPEPTAEAPVAETVATAAEVPSSPDVTAPVAAAPTETPTAPEPPASEPSAEAAPEPGAEDAPKPPRTQAAAIAQDVVFATEPAIPDQDLGADAALEAMEPASSDALDSDGADFADAPAPESTGGREDTHDDDARESRTPARFLRNYKIQEVIRRRQILLVQVVKEERGSKGAALTTYISLAGRFSVLMPNSPRGGGISRKITSAADRRRLKEVTAEMQIPRGMGLIVRTAGANRPKAEIRRDCEYLLELWDSIRETTMASTAPALIHEEASLIKRAIRDNYSRDVDEVLVDGEDGWRAARDFMRMLMPAHARKVQLWTQPQPLFSALAVEAQLDSMLQPTVQLRSGGYLVINQTEALVAIDVNSGRSTRERGIEETAIKTNLEAADEVARQLRLRDLAGLIVIDFIDMESRRNNAAVEKRMKDALKDDRARIQIGSISHFGLMEMSRQRLRPSLAETSFIPCPHCGGTGHVRSTEVSAVAVLRAIEEEGGKRRAAEILVHVASSVALYILNHKRQRIAEIEARYGMTVAFAADESLLPPQTRIERLRAQVPGTPLPAPVVIPIATTVADAEDELVEEEEDETEEATEAGPDGETAEEREQRGRKRRRRRRGSRREDDAPAETPAHAAAPQSFAPALDPALAEQPEVPMPEVPRPGAPIAAPLVPVAAAEPGAETEAAAEAEVETPQLDATAEDETPNRRRGRRGGRRRRRDSPEAEAAGASPPAMGPASFDQPAPVPPAYAGPTPADPFGGGDMFDIFDVLEQAAERATTAPLPAAVPEAPAVAAPVEEPTAVSPEAPAAAPGTTEAEAPAVAPAEPAATVEAASAPAAEPAAEPVTAPEAPVAAAEPESPVAAAPEPTADAAAPTPQPNGHAAPAEPTSVPGPAPVLIGGDTPAAEKKRGWWRR